MSYVNNSPEHRKPLEQLLRDCGIALKSLSVRRQYTVCPKCSSDRKKKKAECLAVTIEDDRVHWFCNHCNDKGCEFYEQEQNVKPNQVKVFYSYSATLRKVRLGKDHKPPFVWEHRDGTEWKSGTGGVKTADLLYRAEDVRAAIAAGKEIAIAEGEKDVDNLWKLGIPATCNAHGAGKWSTSLSDAVANATVVIFSDYDPPGIKHAETVLKSIKKTAKAAIHVNLKDHWATIPESGDISDYIAAGFDVPKLWKSVLESFAEVADKKTNSDKIPEQSGNGHTVLSDDEIEAMAAMGAIELAQTIKKIAADKGVPQAAVKTEYKARKQDLGIADPHQRRRFEIPDTDPWPDPVNGEELACELAAQARRFLVLPDHASVIIALWTICSYAPRIYRITPRLQVTAPEKRCGKTTLLNFLHEVVYRRVKTGNVSTAAFFRIVEGHHPTLLIDEMDTFMNKDEDIRNVLNEGHEINGCVIRCEKIADNFEPVPFSCFAPVAYAHIGKLPKDMGMLLDRSISIHLARRMASEKIDRIDQIKDDEFLPLRQKIKRWVIDNEDAIRNANPDLSNVNDRVRDNWRPLLAIANTIGGPWSDLALAAVANPADDGSFGEMLLEDIRKAFDSARVDFMFSAHICSFLNSLEDRPWSEWGTPPKEISPKIVAKLMGEFGVKPQRDPSHSGKGYSRVQLEPLWERYLEKNELHSPHSKVRKVRRVDSVEEKPAPLQNDKVRQGAEGAELDPDEWQFNQ